MSERLPVTAAGSHSGDFGALHWGHMAVTALIFGSAFMWIALALRSLDPGVIGFGRVALGAATLAVLPPSRRTINRPDWARLATAALAGIAAPALLFAVAEQHIDSAITGMLVSAIPIATTVAAAVMTRSAPGPRRTRGLLIGFTGISLLSAPDLAGAGAAPIGVVLVLVAIAGYAVTNNILVPLIHRYGALPVTMWALTISSVALLPFGAAGLGKSTFEWLPVLSLAILGAIGTGVARALMVSLVGKVGAPRASVTAYFIPMTALFLGVVVLGESVHPIQIAGMLISLGGAYLVSKADEGDRSRRSANVRFGAKHRRTRTGTS